MRKAHVKADPEWDNHDNIIHFSGTFSLERAEEIRQKLCFAMIDCPDLTLDLTEVGKIDLAGLQLICAAHRSALDLGVSVKLSCPLPDHIAEVALKAGFPRKVICKVKEESENSCMWRELVM